MIATITLGSCRRELSDAQKKEMQEARKSQEITRMTDQDIVQAALEAGRLFRRAEEQGDAYDSLEQVYEATLIRHVSTESMNKLEQEIWEAYVFDPGNGEADNIQRDYPDFLYYTYPVMQNDSVAGMVSVRLSRKQIILHH